MRTERYTYIYIYIYILVFLLRRSARPDVAHALTAKTYFTLRTNSLRLSCFLSLLDLLGFGPSVPCACRLQPLLAPALAVFCKASLYIYLHTHRMSFCIISCLLITWGLIILLLLLLLLHRSCPHPIGDISCGDPSSPPLGPQHVYEIHKHY